VIAICDNAHRELRLLCPSSLERSAGTRDATTSFPPRRAPKATERGVGGGREVAAKPRPSGWRQQGRGRRYPLAKRA
jgi:hypothetical protein